MLEIKTTDCDNEVVLIDVIGEITFENSDELRDTIDKITESKNNLVINLLGLKYMSSAGMGVLVHGLKITRSKGGDLRLVNLSEKMRRVFLITQFTNHFVVLSSLEEAINSFKTIS
jgi:anti-sigma B factor antagonist